MHPARPALEFSDPTIVCVTGAPAEVTVDGVPVPMWEPVEVPAGSVLEVAAPVDAGLRTYVAVRGGLDVPLYHGSASTFTLGGFGGPTGRALATPATCSVSRPARHSPIRRRPPPGSALPSGTPGISR